VRVRSNFPFGFKLGLAISLLSVGITAISTYFYYLNTRQLLLHQMQLRLQTAGRLSTFLFDQEAKASIQRLKRSSEQASLAIPPDLIRTLEPGEAQPSLSPEVADRLMQSADFQRLVQILRKISESSRPELQPEQKSYPQPRFKESKNPVSIYTYLLVTVPESPDYQLLKFICSGFYEPTDNWPGNPIGNLFHSPDPVFAKVLQTNRPQFGEQFFTDQWGSWLTVALPIQDQQGQIMAVVGLDYEGSSETNQLRQLQSICFSITAASVGVSILAAYCLAYWLGRPIAKLQAAVQQVQNRDFSTTVELMPNDELGLLAQTFNSMVREIRSYAASLEEKNQELETRVEERSLRLGEANAALQNSEAELRRLFGVMDDVILVFDRHGRCIKVAPTRTDKFFKSPAENLGKTVHEVLPQAVADLQLNTIQRTLTTQATQSVEYSLMLPKGEHWFHANVVPISEDTVVWVARDITDRKQTEAALRLSELKYRNIFENSQVGIGRTRLTDGLFLDVNQHFAELMGFSSAEEMIGQHVSTEFYVHADDRQRILTELEQQGGVRDFELPIRRADGSVFWCLLSVRQNPEEACVEFVMTDISDRKRAEAAQQEQLHLLQVILDALPFPIFYKDAQGLYLGCNQAFLNFRGMTSDQIVGKSVYETAPAHLAETYAAADQALFESRGIQTYETGVAYADGSQHDVIFYKAAFLNQEGDLGGLVGAILDITDRKQAEAALQKSLEQLALANQEIKLLNQRLESENLRLVAELSVARQLQQMILPKEHEFKQIEDLDIAGFMEPADEVGGDYYDILHHEGTVKIGIGDVTGHGLESGMLMVMVQTAVRTLLTNNETDPRHFLNTINQVIYGNARRMQSDRNLTLMLLDYQSGKIKLSGQHEEILVVRTSGQVEQIDTTNLGFFLGLLPDITDFIAEVEVQLQSGDGIVLYTDGITEAENSAKEYYGLERLCQVVSQHWQRSADEIRQVIVEDVRSHIGSHKVYDDITLLVLKQK
jgi:PAS domain S-box-containing protein